MGIDSGIFKFVVVMHVFVSIVGFGTVILNGLYAAQAKARKGPEGLAITEANYKVSKIAQYFIYAVFVLGFALVGLSDEAYELSQTWIWLSAVLLAAGIGLSHGVLAPSVAKIIRLQRELLAGGPPPAGGLAGPPPQVAQIEALGKKVATSAMVLDLNLVVILVLMVWKPGL